MLSITRIAIGQSNTGTIAVSVSDPSGAIVSGARLELTDSATNDKRTAVTESGAYSFVGLPYGRYHLTVSMNGFETSVIDTITVQTARVTDVKVALKLGSTVERVEVSGETSPVIEASSNEIGTTIDMKQIEDLPIGGRDLNNLSTLVPGYTSANGYSSWNGEPAASQGNNVDGVVASSSRFKDFGNATTAVSPRIESIAEMTIETDQLDLNQGFGTSTMQVNFSTRRGGNTFHGRLFDDFQNDGLNANSWYNDAIGQRKGKLIINDFGGTISGPIIKDKLFFFGDYSEQKIPGTNYLTNNVLSSGAQQGNFTYVDTNGVTQNINVLQVAGNAGLGLPSTVNPVIASMFSNINSAARSGLLLQTGNDPNLLTLNWKEPSPTTVYLPVLRIDYDISNNLRVNGSWMMSDTNTANSIGQSFPGQNFKLTGGATGAKYYTAALGVDWTISPTLINQFKGGFLYYFQYSALNALPTNVEQPRVLFGYPGGNFWMSGDSYVEPQSNFYPRFNFSDQVTVQHGAHRAVIGASWYREQDHYWNPPIGYPWVSIGLANGDPAFNVFTNGPTGTIPNASQAQLSEAEQLYAVLVGRISQVSGNTALNVKTQTYTQYGAPNLNELQQAWGMFAQDSWHARPNLTINFGLRWDFTGDDHDLNGMYHSATPADIYGPTALGAEFEPGVLGGDPNPVFTTHGHQYNAWHVSPQPAGGIAWAPGKEGGLLGALLGENKTVIRAGAALRNFTPSYQNFWSYASNYGAFFEGAFYDNPFGTGAGSFTPGSLSLGQAFPPFSYVPPQYLTTAPESVNTFTGSGVAGINPHILEPYVESWNFGIQRALWNSSAIEVRYAGNRSVHLWQGLNTNEVNIFENGFLQQFKAAQQNLAINRANNINSFADNGLPGQKATPIFDAAFAGEASGGPGVPLSDYANGNFLQLLQTGQAGSLAQQLAGGAGPQYLCNLVGGNNFGPCATAGFTGNGAGYPINFFQANPFAAGAGTNYLDSVGYSNYNALQVEFRQRPWQGMEFNVNYTWSHALGLTGGNGQGGPNQYDNTLPIYTMRDIRLNYGPMPFDVRHVVKAYGTYDLPFGKGRKFLNGNAFVDRIVGGWTVGTIFTFQTGNPFYLTGGYSTFNNIADGGVVLNGVTRSQVQNATGVYRTGNPYAYGLNPAAFVSASGAASSAITPNTTPGTLMPTIWLFGPHAFYDDASITKHIVIHENLRFSLQAEFLNAFNHPVWGTPTAYGSQTASVQSLSFATIGVTNSPRAIELRANVEF